MHTFKRDRILAQESLLAKSDFNQLATFKNDTSLLEVLKLMNLHTKGPLEIRLESIKTIKEDQETGN